MKLQEMRKAAGLSQSQLAEIVGMNRRTLQSYEQGKKIFDHARIDTILKVCNALCCRLEDVIENPDFLALLEEYERKNPL